MEIINKKMIEFEEELEKNGIPFLVKYFNYFNGSGGYRNFWITDIEGESTMFEVERFENPIDQTFKVFFVADQGRGEFEVEEEHDVINQPYIKEKYKLMYDADKKEWIRENLEYYNEEEE